jgi:hypothetical protein
VQPTTVFLSFQGGFVGNVLETGSIVQWTGAIRGMRSCSISISAKDLSIGTKYEVCGEKQVQGPSGQLRVDTGDRRVVGVRAHGPNAPN